MQCGLGPKYDIVLDPDTIWLRTLMQFGAVDLSVICFPTQMWFGPGSKCDPVMGPNVIPSPTCDLWFGPQPKCDWVPNQSAIRPPAWIQLAPQVNCDSVHDPNAMTQAIRSLDQLCWGAQP